MTVDLPAPPRPDQRVLITGAAGGIGRFLREAIADRYRVLRLSDRIDIGPARPGEEVVTCDIQDMAACLGMTTDVDCIVHLGGRSIEDTWEEILGPNIIGCYNVFEAARQNGVKRITFASSNHAIGFHPVDRVLDSTALLRPDTRYGLSKAFGENLGRLYADKHGLQVACIRIGSFQPEPKDTRMLSTWLSPGDLARMITTCIDAGEFHFFTAYGMSNNSRRWWTNEDVTAVRFDLADSADVYADNPDLPGMPDELSARFHGGVFCRDEFTGDPSKIQ